MESSAPATQPQPTTFPDERRGLVARGLEILRDRERRQAYLSLADQGVVSATNFLTSVLIGRLCSPSGLGSYFLALTIFLFLRAVQENGICAPYTVYRHKQRERLPSYAGSSMLHAGLLMLLSAIGIAIAGGFSLLGWEAASIGGVVWALLPAIPLMLLREYIRRFSLAHMQAGVGLAVDVAISAIYLASLGVLIWHGELTVFFVYLSLGGACLLAGLAWAIFAKPHVQFSRREAVADWKTNWPFAKWALASHFLGSSIGLILPWFVAGINGRAETGLLAAGTAIVGLGNMFVNGVCNWLHPRAAGVYSEHGAEGLSRLISRTAIMFTACLGVFAVGGLIAGNWLIETIYGTAYDGAGLVLGILAIAMLTNSLTMTFGNGLWALDRAKANFRADLAALCITTAISIGMIPYYGALGAAIAIASGSAADALYRARIFRKELRTA